LVKLCRYVTPLVFITCDASVPLVAIATSEIVSVELVVYGRVLRVRWARVSIPITSSLRDSFGSVGAGFKVVKS
jgi:hypothetical protein